MKKQANKTASSGSSDKDSSAESSAPEEGEPGCQAAGHTHTVVGFQKGSQKWRGGVHALQQFVMFSVVMDLLRLPMK